MSDLYAPPKSDVESSVLHKLRPPASVISAICLYVASFVIGWIRLQIEKSWFESTISIVLMILFVAFIYAISKGLWKGKSWLRGVCITVSFLEVAFIPWSLQDIPNQWGRNVYLAQGVMQVMAAILLLLPTASQWFRLNKELQQTAIAPPE